MGYPSDCSASCAFCLALVAAVAAWPEGPASAAIVEARVFGAGAFVDQVIRTSDGAQLPKESVAVSPGLINPEVLRTTPGVSAASDSDVVSVTNLTDVEVRVSLGFDGSTFVFAELDSPTQRARASTFLEFSVDGERFDGSGVSLTLNGFFCIDPPAPFSCHAEDLDSFGAGTSLVLAPFETPGFFGQANIEGSVRAELSIIPVPASAGLMLIGIGALGWTGRRRALQTLHL